MQRADDGYIYPADGSSDAQIYPAPRDSRRVYENTQQAYRQPPPQYYNNPGYGPPQGYYYQQRQYYQPRGYSQD
jgi:hypothetical protein